MLAVRDAAELAEPSGSSSTDSSQGSGFRSWLCAGALWKTTWVHPTLWTEPTEPRCVVEPLLPDGLALDDDHARDGIHDNIHDGVGAAEEEGEEGSAVDQHSSRVGGGAAVVGFREVSLSDDQVGDHCSQPLPKSSLMLKSCLVGPAVA